MSVLHPPFRRLCDSFTQAADQAFYKINVRFTPLVHPTPPIHPADRMDTPPSPTEQSSLSAAPRASPEREGQGGTQTPASPSGEGRSTTQDTPVPQGKGGAGQQDSSTGKNAPARKGRGGRQVLPGEVVSRRRDRWASLLLKYVSGSARGNPTGIRLTSSIRYNPWIPNASPAREGGGAE